MKPSSGKQDKPQLGDTDDRGSCLNESCLQPSRGIMFLRTLAYPDRPLNGIQLHLASAESAERGRRGDPAPRPHTQPQSSTDLQGALGAWARGARLHWGSVWTEWRETASKAWRERTGRVPSHVSSSAREAGATVCGSFSGREAAAGRSGGAGRGVWKPFHAPTSLRVRGRHLSQRSPSSGRGLRPPG